MRGRTSTHIGAVALAGALLASLLTGPVGAQNTKEKLEDARARLAEVESEAQAATAEYEAARGRLIQTEDEIQATRQRLEAVAKRANRLQTRLGERASEAYKMGASGMLDLLFVSDSLSEFSDRMVFLDRIAQEDADLVLRADVLAERLERYEADLDALLKRQAETTKILREKRELIYEKLEEAQAIKAKLEDKLAAEEAAARAAAQAASRSAPGSTDVVVGGALQACPVPGSTFVDSWGAPRSGGRSHQGVDMMAPYGTPVYAATAGSMTQSSSSLGGNQAYVQAPNGDVTFYAHLQGYEGGPRGVSAGELIGYVGDTGNATGTPHLHFEYHPGGGAAVNPYPYVAAVC
ncbi:MAG TPA: peptidoglycan DD-metalloendopeptidase family protein [Actinomycetota bacterium]